MAASAGGTVPQFEKQLKTTAMFYDPASAIEFGSSDDLKTTMEFVANFSFNHGLFPMMADSPEYIGIQFPDGSIYGDKNNVLLRFDTLYMQLAAEGKL